MRDCDSKVGERPQRLNDTREWLRHSICTVCLNFKLKIWLEVKEEEKVKISERET